MANRKNYTVTVPFPRGGGHWAKRGAEVELLDVEALALLQAGRVVLTAEIEAAAAEAGAVLVEPAAEAQALPAAEPVADTPAAAPAKASKSKQAAKE